LLHRAAPAIAPNAESNVGEELHCDVAACRAERPPEANLGPPLEHGDDHDVRDAEPTDDECDGGEPEEQSAKRLLRRGPRGKRVGIDEIGLRRSTHPMSNLKMRFSRTLGLAVALGACALVAAIGLPGRPRLVGFGVALLCGGIAATLQVLEVRQGAGQGRVRETFTSWAGTSLPLPDV
jgi:hypothetical protein